MTMTNVFSSLIFAFISNYGNNFSKLVKEMACTILQPTKSSLPFLPRYYWNIHYIKFYKLHFSI